MVLLTLLAYHGALWTWRQATIGTLAGFGFFAI
jgi:hypothetical protein